MAIYPPKTAKPYLKSGCLVILCFLTYILINLVSWTLFALPNLAKLAPYSNLWQPNTPPSKVDLASLSNNNYKTMKCV
ncbi:hypothetical protein THIOM_003177 [Candidatus Thiomargarita nelsonii]|uniref:Uncharacterized protein n=1 Tax=Candidatus Thiomargarita nelsonii TaxID=1003181 RepID=A0A176RZ50_9GAMM|nr:hypothetical protein THIOM_003177 [Candidatus Thiomargarita nelsonii]